MNHIRALPLVTWLIMLQLVFLIGATTPTAELEINSFEGEQTFVLYHNLGDTNGDRSREWTPRGTVQLIHYPKLALRFDPYTLSNKQYQQLLNQTYYRVRLADAEAYVHVCHLIGSHLTERINVHLDQNGHVQAIDYRTHTVPECDTEGVHAWDIKERTFLPLGKPQLGRLADGPKMEFQSQANQQQHQKVTAVDDKNNEKPKPRSTDESFWSKYWMYIVPVVIIAFLQLLQPQQPQQAGTPNGARTSDQPRSS